MARCPFCNEVLDDTWLKTVGATIMGKASGASKARSRGTMQAAAHKRWEQQREEEKALDARVTKALDKYQQRKRKRRQPKIPT